ncbi:hypothetical protein [Reinekea sp. G2M2-21]|uniref:hypothetical protein n=1 Tax=Reinekea sp. G2M2-21 TaxID=2788942 RepID=UPI0018AC245B|nr:hypothetical protein [Reinekea sp. G2M2-21]
MPKKNSHDHLKFPTGLSVRHARQKAKQIVRDENIQLAKALRQIATENGIDKEWAEAMKVLAQTSLTTGAKKTIQQLMFESRKFGVQTTLGDDHRKESVTLDWGADTADVDFSSLLDSAQEPCIDVSMFSGSASSDTKKTLAKLIVDRYIAMTEEHRQKVRFIGERKAIYEFLRYSLRWSHQIMGNPTLAHFDLSHFNSENSEYLNVSVGPDNQSITPCPIRNNTIDLALLDDTDLTVNADGWGKGHGESQDYAVVLSEYLNLPEADRENIIFEGGRKRILGLVKRCPPEIRGKLYKSRSIAAVMSTVNIVGNPFAELEKNDNQPRWPIRNTLSKSFGLPFKPK